MEAKNAVALVTGANRGIGRALVEALLERGAARVYATTRNLADRTPVAALDAMRVRTLQLDVTDMARGIEMAKTSPAEVARAVLDGIQAGTEDIFPDPVSQQLYAAWKADHKAVERQFASM